MSLWEQTASWETREVTFKMDQWTSFSFWHLFNSDLEAGDALIKKLLKFYTCAENKNQRLGYATTDSKIVKLA